MPDSSSSCSGVHGPDVPGTERASYDPQAAMIATLRAGNRVRDGFPNWLKGAPTHVLAELLTALKEDGWTLVPAARLSEVEAELHEAREAAKRAGRYALDRERDLQAAEGRAERAEAELRKVKGE